METKKVLLSRKFKTLSIGKTKGFDRGAELVIYLDLVKSNEIKGNTKIGSSI